MGLPLCWPRARTVWPCGSSSGVYVLENRPLARALYASCQLDREIPAEYYGAVAEILVYIYKATNREDMFNR